MLELRQLWEDTSYQLERLQCNPQCAEEERKNIYDRPGMLYHVSFTPEPTPEKWMNATDKPKVAIIREEGSNGDREMTSAFYMAGFEPWDVTMTDLLSGVVTLDMFRGIAFVGGFSYADVLDSAKGWAGVIRFNPQLWDQFERFYHRKDTFSLGVCNGCQLMALLGWVPWRGISGGLQPRFIHNVSGRFESRFSTVKILPSPALMLQDMDGSELGVWVAHGEGRLYFPSEPELDSVIRNDWAPIRYVDDNGAVTCDYPYNPNGSPMGIAALCSPDGRHLAMMPHPERAFLNWQWGYLPQGWDPKRVSPWLKMFQNARK
jgi:phosphoribosylformylglycinamidine synthase